MNTSHYIYEAKLHRLYNLKSYSQVHIPINLFCKNNTFFLFCFFDFFFFYSKLFNYKPRVRERGSKDKHNRIDKTQTDYVCFTIEAGIKINKSLYYHKSNNNVHIIMACGWIVTMLILVPKENKSSFSV